MDHAKITDPHAGPKAFAMDPNVIANPFTEARFPAATEELMSKKLEVKAMHVDILANDEHTNTAANKGMPGQT